MPIDFKILESPVSSLIVSFASAAATAQNLMSNSPSPMTIKEYEFNIKANGSLNLKDTGDVNLHLYLMDPTNSFSFETNFGCEISIGCKIVAAFLLNGKN